MDRKTMIREYQRRRPPMGVFQVRNRASGNSVKWGSGTALERVRQA